MAAENPVPRTATRMGAMMVVHFVKHRSRDPSTYMTSGGDRTDCPIEFVPRECTATAPTEQRCLRACPIPKKREEA
jgi:hypothetical protein